MSMDSGTRAWAKSFDLHELKGSGFSGSAQEGRFLIGDILIEADSSAFSTLTEPDEKYSHPLRGSSSSLFL